MYSFIVVILLFVASPVYAEDDGLDFAKAAYTRICSGGFTPDNGRTCEKLIRSIEATEAKRAEGCTFSKVDGPVPNTPMGKWVCP